MKLTHKTLLLIAATGALSACGTAALADASKGQPVEGASVQTAVALGQLPREVRSGSVQVKKEDVQAMIARARVTSGEAARLAVTATKGKVLATKLDDDNGYLIWEVDVLGPQGKQTELKIDAGNGRLLAAASGTEDEHEDRDEEKHSGWKFWEKDDEGKGKAEDD
jgi:uncharacterized membrane protein YkoI